MSKDEDDYERRKQQRLRKLGTNEPRCGCCGELRWQALEQHHVAGRAHDDTIVIVCASDHKVLTDAQQDHPPKQESVDPWLEAVGRFLLGLADMLRIVIERLVEFGRVDRIPCILMLAKQATFPVLSFIRLPRIRCCFKFNPNLARLSLTPIQPRLPIVPREVHLRGFLGCCNIHHNTAISRR